jgi:Peptidase_C39 like family
VVGGVTAAATASPPTSTVAASATTAKGPATAKVASSKSVKHSFQLQSNFYFCGPSATRVALSAHGKVYTQSQVAQKLGTTQDGTNSANDVTRVMNQELGKTRYHTVELSGSKITAGQINQLKSDVVTAINHGDPVVANVAGTITDTKGDVHSYEGGHYLPIVGYSHHGDNVQIADSADTVGSPYYTVDANTMAHWMATRGYAA